MDFRFSLFAVFREVVLCLPELLEFQRDRTNAMGSQNASSFDFSEVGHSEFSICDSRFGGCGLGGLGV